MPAHPGQELEPEKSVFRLVRSAFIPEGAEFPTGGTFEPSSEEKASSPVRVSVWDPELTTVAQARALYSGTASNIACILRVKDLAKLRARRPLLRVVWEPIRPNRGPGSDGHCGIEGLKRPDSESRVQHKVFLDDLAALARRFDEVSFHQARARRRSRVWQAIEVLFAVSLVVTIAAVLLRMMSKEQRPTPLATADPAASSTTRKEEAIASDLSAAMEESEKASDSGSLARTTFKEGYVYLGLCDGNNWSVSFFSGLPDCQSTSPKMEISALRGTKVRATLPTGGTFGAEVGRLTPGERVKLISIRPRAGDSEGRRRFMWGEIKR